MPSWLQRGGGRNDPGPPSRPHLRLFGYPWSVRVPRQGRWCVLRGRTSTVPSPCYLRVTTTSGPGGTPFQHVISLQGTGTSPSDRAGRCRRRRAMSRTPDPPGRVGVAPGPAPNPSAKGWSPFPAGLRSRGVVALKCGQKSWTWSGSMSSYVSTCVSSPPGSEPGPAQPRSSPALRPPGRPPPRCPRGSGPGPGPGRSR